MTISSIIWDMNPDLISSPVTIRWYGLMFAIGFLMGYEIVGRMFRHEGAPEKWLGLLLVWVMGGTIIGARLGHCFFYEWDFYSAHPEKIIRVWEGGLASHGGAIGVIIAVLLFSLFTSKRSPMWTFDRLVIPIALVGGLIRLGNLFNSEIFGGPTDLPWGMMFVNSAEWRALYPEVACHPTQIYEALSYFALFGLLMWMYWKRNSEERPGLIFGVFLVGVFLSRFFIEFIKNNQEAFEDDMILNMGQCLSIPFVLAGVVLIVRALMRPRQHLTFPNRYADEKPAKKR